MKTKLKIKILAIGSQAMLRRLNARLNQNEVSFKGCSTAYELPAILQQDSFDMIILDNLFGDSETICRNAVNAGKMPVAVIFKKSGTDWKKLRELEVDGFFPDEAGSHELMARIKAFSRRWSEPCPALSA